MMRKINIQISGEAGAGSTTIANVVTDCLKKTFPSQLVRNVDQDDMPDAQSARIKTLENEPLYVVVDTRQAKAPGARDYVAEVQTLLKSLPAGNCTNYKCEQIQQIITLANEVGNGTVGGMYIDAVVSWLKNWSEKPQKVDSLHSREIESGERKKGEGKHRKGKRGGFGLHG